MLSRYDRTQNATNVIAGADLKAGDVVDYNPSANAILKSEGERLPLGVVQSDVKSAGIVEFATGNVAITMSTEARPGNVVFMVEGGAIEAADYDQTDDAILILGTALTFCKEGGKAVVAWDVDLVAPSGTP